MTYLNILINTLNDDLAVEMASGVSAEEAVETVAGEWDLVLIADSADTITGRPDGVCRLYRQRGSGAYVNCWTEGVMSDRPEDGGVGFDAQDQWYWDQN